MSKNQFDIFGEILIIQSKQNEISEKVSNDSILKSQDILNEQKISFEQKKEITRLLKNIFWSIIVLIFCIILSVGAIVERIDMILPPSL